MTLLMGVIADDVTGGLEAAAMLRAQGVRCDLVSDPRLAEEDDGDAAVVVAQRTRVAPRDEAVRAVGQAAEALRKRGARQLFFKYCATFDSTDEGNIGPCAEVFRESTSSELTLFVPSFPEAGRRVFQGHLFVGDTLVSESPKRHDPLTPMTDPNLMRVLQRQTAIRVGLLPHEVLSAGPAAMSAHCRELVRSGTGFAIADALYPEDLDRIAALTADWPLMTGNSSITAYYPRYWREAGRLLPSQEESRGIPGVSGAGVALAGSCSDRTMAQLARFAALRPTLMIDLHDVLDGRDAVGTAVEWALPKLSEGPVAIATSASPDIVASIQTRVGRRKGAALAEDVLGRIASRLREAGVRRFLVAGGETSGSVLEHLGVKRLRVGAYESPGISQAIAEGGTPLAFCLKSGKLGPEDMFLDMLQRMEKGEARA